MAEAEQIMGGGRAGYRAPPQTAVGINILFLFIIFMYNLDSVSFKKNYSYMIIIVPPIKSVSQSINQTLS